MRISDWSSDVCSSDLTDADVGDDGQLRFGVVPYSSTVNVGQILRDADSAWLSESVTLPSRRGDGWKEVEECGWQGSGWRREWVCAKRNRYFYRYEDRPLPVGDRKHVVEG